MTAYIKSSVSVDKHSYNTTVFLGAQGETVNTTTDAYVTTQKQRIGVSLPGYKVLIKNHQNAVTPLVASEDKFEISPSTYIRSSLREHYFPFGKYEQKTSGKIVTITKPHGTPTSANYTNADAVALEKFYANVVKAQTAVQGGVLLGELRETINLIKNPAMAIRKRIDDYMSDLKKNRRRVSQRNKKRFLQNKWLEYSFGWAPLVSELDGAMRYAAEERSLKPEYYYIVGEGTSQYEQKDADLIISHSGCTSTQSTYTTEEWAVKYYGEVKSHANKPGKYHSTMLGLDGGNFLPTVWELIPYSFVVDYFTNVGKVLTALSVGLTADIRWRGKNQRSEVRRGTADTVAKSFVPFDPISEVKIAEVAEPGKQTWICRSVARGAVYGLQIPPLRFQIPSAGSLKWLNLAALATVNKSMTPY